jgi:hypothetical protein
MGQFLLVRVSNDLAEKEIDSFVGPGWSEPARTKLNT